MIVPASMTPQSTTTCTANTPTHPLRVKLNLSASLLLLLLLPAVAAAQPSADNLLAKKSHKQLLHDYEARRAAAVDFMVLVRPGLTVTAGALSDPQVGGTKGALLCDHNQQTAASYCWLGCDGWRAERPTGR